MRRHEGTVPALIDTLRSCTRYGARFADRTGQAHLYTYAEIVARATRAAGVLQARGLRPGDRVGVILPTSVQFFDAYLGVMLAGGVPAALYPPLRLGRLSEYLPRTQAALARIGARFLILDPPVKRLIGSAVQGLDRLTEVLDAGDLQQDATWRPVAPDPDAPALLQLSSGTTAAPKAIILTHRNLLHSLAMIDGYVPFLGQGPSEAGGVCWLPLYHDMGLIGCLFIGLYHPVTMTYLRPEHFLAKPALWLQTIARYRAAASPAPDFAYGLSVTRIRDEEMAGVDLSCWRLACNGAEAIDTRTMRRFIERFGRWGLRPETVTPVYGLAEAGLAVTFSDPATPPLVTEFDREALAARGLARPGRGRALPSVGRPVPGLEVVVRPPDGRPAEGRIGRIWVRGPSITAGYDNDPETTARAIDRGWLDTGDLGFVHAGELYISGRAKDVIIIRGRNYAPQEIEGLLLDLPGVRRGCAVAVADAPDEGADRLTILAERDRRDPRPDDEVVASIRHAVLAGLALIPDTVQLLAPGALPRTSSGKLRRAEALARFRQGRLGPPAAVAPLTLLARLARSQLAWVRRWLQRVGRPRTASST